MFSYPIKTRQRNQPKNVKRIFDKKNLKCAFIFEIIDWMKGKEREQKRLDVTLKNKEDTNGFVKAFNVFLLSIQYFDYGNLNL